MIFAVADILDSGGRYPDRAKKATSIQIANADVLVTRVNALLKHLGVTTKPQITSGLRLTPGIGAQKSAHLEGKAVDFLDPEHKIANRITRSLLAQFRLRREDTDYTEIINADGTATCWCHLDTRLPYGSVFAP